MKRRGSCKGDAVGRTGGQDEGPVRQRPCTATAWCRSEAEAVHCAWCLRQSGALPVGCVHTAALMPVAVHCEWFQCPLPRRH